MYAATRASNVDNVTTTNHNNHLGHLFTFIHLLHLYVVSAYLKQFKMIKTILNKASHLHRHFGRSFRYLIRRNLVRNKPHIMSTQ